MTSTEHTLGSLVDLLIEMEDKVGRFYGLLVEKFCESVEFRELTAALQDDEKVHYDFLQRLRQQLANEQLARPVPNLLLTRVLKNIRLLDLAMTDEQGTLGAVLDNINEVEATEFDIVFEVVDARELSPDLYGELLEHMLTSHQEKLLKLLKPVPRQLL